MIQVLRQTKPDAHGVNERPNANLRPCGSTVLSPSKGLCANRCSAKASPTVEEYAVNRIVLLVLAFTMTTFASGGETFVLDPSIPERSSPVTFDVDADWLPSLQSGTWNLVKGLPTFHSDGALLRSIMMMKASGGGRTTKIRFLFMVGLRRGRDRMLTLEYGLFDGNDHSVASGRVSGNLNEHECTHIEGTFKVNNEELASLTANGSIPTLRIAMTVVDADP